MITITRYIVIYCKIYQTVKSDHNKRLVTLTNHDQKKGLPSTVLRNDLVGIQTQFNDINQMVKIICYVSIELSIITFINQSALELITISDPNNIIHDQIKRLTMYLGMIWSAGKMNPNSP
jgi:hypothetical protein